MLANQRQMTTWALRPIALDDKSLIASALPQFPIIISRQHRGRVQWAVAAQLTHSCHAATLFLVLCHLVRRTTDLCVVVLFGGERPGWAPCCSPCCCNYSVVWAEFSLTFCIPFASQGDWNKSKHYSLPCGKLIALDVYVLFFTE